MSHKVHPYSFRLGFTRNWRSRWFNLKKYKNFLRGDVLIIEHIERILKGMYVDSVEIERGPSVFYMIIKTSRPGLVIGRSGEGAKRLKEEIIKKAVKAGIELPKEVKLSIEEVRFPETRANIVAQMVIENLEKRMPFRRILKQTAEKVMANRQTGGVRIALSGRLGGAEMARREWIQRGRMPLQTLRADIDFACAKAVLPYGVIGVKVWIYRKEEEAREKQSGKEKERY